MSRFSQGKTEFHQLILPSGDTIDLHTASKNGKWVLSSQGWGLPPVSWQTTRYPFQHGSTVRDFRLEPRTIQLLTYQSFCGRDGFWAGREDLMDAIKPNQTPISYTDYWLQRSQAEIGGTDHAIVALEEFNGKLYGLTDDAHLLVWDDVGAWYLVSEPPGNDESAMDVGYHLHTCVLSLLETNLTIPIEYLQLDGSTAHSVGGTEWDAQGFTTTESIWIESIDIYLKTQVGASAGNIDVSIRAVDAAGLPTGADLATGAITVASSHVGWNRIDLTAGIQLDAATGYSIVVSAPTMGGAAFIRWAFHATGSFSAGISAGSADSGSTWGTGGAWRYFFRLVSSDDVWTEDKALLWASGWDADAGYGVVWAWDGEWSQDHWAHASNSTYCYQMADMDGELYVGADNAYLLQYDRDGTVHHLDEPSMLMSNNESLSLEAFSGQIFIAGSSDGTGSGAELDYWDGANEHSVANQAEGTQHFIYDLCEYQGKLYGITEHGRLEEWNGVNAWVNKAGSLSVATGIYHLVVYKGRLYAAGTDGTLQVWDNSSAWVSVCTALTISSGLQEVRPLTVYRNRLFGGTYDGSLLMEWIHDAAYDEPQPLVLRRFLSNGEKRDLEVFIGEGPQFDDMPGGWREHSFQELLRFVAYNPVLYDPDTVTITYTMGVGMISEAQNVDYTGTWEEHPTITIAGPLHELTIINETIGEYIKLDYDIPDAVTVTIDCQKLTIEDSLHNNLLSALTPESSFATFRFEPHPVIPAATGRNVIRVIGHGSDAGTTLHIDYKRRFIGI